MKDLPVTLNHLDHEGNQVDTETMDVPADLASDIIDKAAQLMIVCGNIADGQDTIESFDQALANLSASLTDADIVGPVELPVLQVCHVPE